MFEIKTMFLITIFLLFKTATSSVISIPSSNPKKREKRDFPKLAKLNFDLYFLR